MTLKTFIIFRTLLLIMIFLYLLFSESYRGIVLYLTCLLAHNSRVFHDNVLINSGYVLILAFKSVLAECIFFCAQGRISKDGLWLNRQFILAEDKGGRSMMKNLNRRLKSSWQSDRNVAMVLWSQRQMKKQATFIQLTGWQDLSKMSLCSEKKIGPIWKRQ